MRVSGRMGDDLRAVLMAAGPTPWTRGRSRCLPGEVVWDEEGHEWERCRYEDWFQGGCCAAGPPVEPTCRGLTGERCDADGCAS